MGAASAEGEVVMAEWGAMLGWEEVHFFHCSNGEQKTVSAV